MARYEKSPMHKGQNKIARFKRLDQLLRSPEGHTLNEILNDEQLDCISKRLLQDNLKEIKERYGAEFKDNLFRGRERLWRYKDTSFSIMQQTSVDMEIIRKSIENLDFFKGDPRYDMLRFYLVELENGMSGSEINFMSFDYNNDVAGLEFIEEILNAIVHKYPLKMWYKPFSGKEMERNIHPYHLRQYNRRWFLFALCEEQKKIHNFPIDRIVKLEHLSKSYIESNINFDEYFDDIVGVTNYSNAPVEKIVLKINNSCINYIRTKPIHWSQKELKECSTEDYTIIQLNVKVNTELKMLLFSYSDAIEILEPVWLRDSFAKRVKNMSNTYKV